MSTTLCLTLSLFRRSRQCAASCRLFVLAITTLLIEAVGIDPPVPPATLVAYIRSRSARSRSLSCAVARSVRRAALL